MPRRDASAVVRTLSNQEAATRFGTRWHCCASGAEVREALGSHRSATDAPLETVVQRARRTLQLRRALLQRQLEDLQRKYPNSSTAWIFRKAEAQPAWLTFELTDRRRRLEAMPYDPSVRPLRPLDSSGIPVTVRSPGSKIWFYRARTTEQWSESIRSIDFEFTPFGIGYRTSAGRLILHTAFGLFSPVYSITGGDTEFPSFEPVLQRLSRERL